MRFSRCGVRLVALLTIGSSACVRPLVPGSGRVFPPNDVLPKHPGSTIGRPDSTSSVRSGFSRKLVSGKESPSILVARDGSRCSVSEKRFNETTEGEQIWCAWTDGG